jgi:thioesterase domain-containing protein
MSRADVAQPVLVPMGRPRPGRCSVLVHAAGGGVGAYTGVGFALRRSGPVVALRGYGLAPGEEPDRSVAAMTDRYWSLLAELPEPLAEEGRRPRVVMVDSPAARIDRDPAAARRWRERVHASLAADDSGVPADRVAATADAHLDAVVSYRAEVRHDCPTLLMPCADEDNEEHLAAWREVATHLTVRPLPGDHFTAFDGERLPLLLDHLGAFLTTTEEQHA